MNLIDVDINKLIPYANNPRKNDEAVDPVANSIREFGFKVPLVIDKENNVVCGHTRLKAAKKLGLKTVPCIIADDLTEEQIAAFRLADNKVGELAEWNFELLDEELDGIFDIDMEQFGFDIDDKEKDEKIPNTLRNEFFWPPFSVLDARSAEWQNRKKEWNKVLKSGEGRGEGLLGSGLKKLAEKSGSKTLTGTSIFDPVLCEILINWFSPRYGKIIDPFSGGSVRGIVSQFLEREYHGNDLRKEQIEENENGFLKLEGGKDFFGEEIKRPKWYCGDSLDIDKIIADKDFDMMLTCPPYADLEVYSDNEHDISNMDYPDFIDIYKKIIAKTAQKLKDNSFACIVVGEVRDKKGIYRNFIGDTIEIAKEAGLKYYNELVLITMVGTGAMRARKPFSKTRKVMNTHQKALIFFKSKEDKDMEEMIKAFDNSRACVPMKESVLVFLKGDPREASFPIDKYNFPEF